MPAANTIATRIASVFMAHWVASYRITSIVLTDSVPQFTAKCFAAICKELGVEMVLTTEYHPQSHGQIERFNPTGIPRLTHYLAKIQKSWNTFMSLLTYASKVQVP